MPRMKVLLNETFGSALRRGFPVLFYYGIFEQFGVAHYGCRSANFSKSWVLSGKTGVFSSHPGISSPTQNLSWLQEKEGGPRRCSVPAALCFQKPQW
jgi:hypothetical protein